MSVQKTVYAVPVREIVEFALSSGDLGGPRDFVGSKRALAGTRGHQQIQRSRPAGYEKEVSLAYEVEREELVLRIQGRIDGLQVTPEQVLLEEIKTVQGRWDGTANPLHWGQAKFYAFIYAQQHALQKITVQLTYLNLEGGEITEFQNDFELSELSNFFEQATAIYLEWIREQHRWYLQRDQSIKALDFPFPQYRPGQRKLAVAAYRALAQGGRLFIEAPTGIGKTMSVVFPALKAMAEGKLERIFYLTARTVGRAVAEKAFADMRQAGLRLHVLTLTAKEKICFQDGHVCDPMVCPFAAGYYDRRRPAMREALAQEMITREALEAVSRRHQVCPFELSLDLSTWVDAVICDYNYVFDPKVYLRRHFEDKPGEVGFLIDEAHNLVDRAREMFSADLDSHEIREVKRAIKTALPRCAKALTKLQSGLRALAREAGQATESAEDDELSGELALFAGKNVPAGTGIEADKKPLPLKDARDQMLTTAEMPADLVPLLENALQEAETWLAQNQPAEFREDLLELYFRLNSFLRTAKLYDERYVTFIEPGRWVRVRLFCLDPSFLLQGALKRGKAAVFFSATLTPSDYYQYLLGGSPEDPVLKLASPFPRENLAVLVHDRVRTHYKARAESLTDVVEAIGAFVQERPGNYLVYFPSYQYLQSVLEPFQALYPSIQLLVQKPGMNEAERDVFLAAFAAERKATLVGFAVLGGVFGEGIDLVGDRLIGAVIVGVGLPQLCVERDLVRDYFQKKSGAGFDYAYTFPGMNRVCQATGRVIRTETDRGLVLLLDTRFAETRYQRLFPAWWQAVRVRNSNQIREAVRRFWNGERAGPLA